MRVAARFALAALMSCHYEVNTTTRVVSDQLGRHKGGGFEGKGEQGGSNPAGGASHHLPLTSDLGQCRCTLSVHSSSAAAAAPASFSFLFLFHPHRLLSIGRGAKAKVGEWVGGRGGWADWWL